MWAASQTEPAFEDSMILAIAMLSLSYIFVLCALFGMGTRRPDPLFCAPIVWGLFWVWRSNAAKPNLPAEMITSVDIAAAHVYTGVCVMAVMALLLRLSMVCVSNRVPEAYQKGGIEEAGLSVIFDNN